MSKLQSEQCEGNGLAPSVWTPGKWWFINSGQKGDGKWDGLWLWTRMWVLWMLCGGKGTQTSLPTVDKRKGWAPTQTSTQRHVWKGWDSITQRGWEYFVTFINDHTRHVWVYILKHILKHKGESFQQFKEWRTLVEKSSGKQINTLLTDNGGEYTLMEFTSTC